MKFIFLLGCLVLVENLWADGYDMSHFAKDPNLTAVTHEFGASIIRMAQLPYKSGVAKSDVLPWSSWWYPRKDPFLFQDGEDLSPLSKYDLYRRARIGNAVESAAEYERGSYNINALPWEGLCDAWAIAAVLHPEPKHPVTFNANGKKITFALHDLKALLLKTYEAVDDSNFKYYGQKFTGDSRGWIYPDIFPDQLHRFVEVELFQNRRAFIMDHDPGVEVWNVPVYKANYLVDRLPGYPNAVFVRLWLYSAEAVLSDNKDFVGSNEAVREYDYVLLGDRNDQGDLLVTSGYWVKGPSGIDSRNDHPDYVIKINSPQVERKSWNPQIDAKIVDEILASSY